MDEPERIDVAPIDPDGFYVHTYVGPVTLRSTTRRRLEIITADGLVHLSREQTLALGQWIAANVE